MISSIKSLYDWMFQKQKPVSEQPCFIDYLSLVIDSIPHIGECSRLHHEYPQYRVSGVCYAQAHKIVTILGDIANLGTTATVLDVLTELYDHFNSARITAEQYQATIVVLREFVRKCNVGNGIGAIRLGLCDCILNMKLAYQWRGRRSQSYHYCAGTPQVKGVSHCTEYSDAATWTHNGHAGRSRPHNPCVFGEVVLPPGTVVSNPLRSAIRMGLYRQIHASMAWHVYDVEYRANPPAGTPAAPTLNNPADADYMWQFLLNSLASAPPHRRPAVEQAVDEVEELLYSYETLNEAWDVLATPPSPIRPTSWCLNLTPLTELESCRIIIAETYEDTTPLFIAHNPIYRLFADTYTLVEVRRYSRTLPRVSKNGAPAVFTSTVGVETSGDLAEEHGEGFQIANVDTLPFAHTQPYEQGQLVTDGVVHEAEVRYKVDQNGSRKVGVRRLNALAKVEASSI